MFLSHGEARDWSRLNRFRLLPRASKALSVSLAIENAVRGIIKQRYRQNSSVKFSLHLDVGGLHDRGPQRILIGEQFTELSRRSDLDVGAERIEPSARRRIIQTLAKSGIELVDDIRGGSGRRDHAEPEWRDQLRIACFCRGRHVGQFRGARDHGDGDRPHRSGLDVRQDSRAGVGGDLNLASQQGSKDRRRAAVGLVDEVGPGFEFE